MKLNSPLDIKKLLDDEHASDDLDTSFTVADVFVDHGKAQADGLDQRGTVRVVQKPSERAHARFPSVTQDWVGGGAAEESNDTRRQTAQVPPTAYERSGESEAPPIVPFDADQRDVPMSTVEKDDSSANPALVNGGSNLDGSGDELVAGPRMESVELGSPTHYRTRAHQPTSTIPRRSITRIVSSKQRNHGDGRSDFVEESPTATVLVNQHDAHVEESHKRKTPGTQLRPKKKPRLRDISDTRPRPSSDVSLPQDVVAAAASPPAVSGAANTSPTAAPSTESQNAAVHASPSQTSITPPTPASSSAPSKQQAEDDQKSRLAQQEAEKMRQGSRQRYYKRKEHLTEGARKMAMLERHIVQLQRKGADEAYLNKLRAWNEQYTQQLKLTKRQRRESSDMARKMQPGIESLQKEVADYETRSGLPLTQDIIANEVNQPDAAIEEENGTAQGGPNGENSTATRGNNKKVTQANASNEQNQVSPATVNDDDDGTAKGNSVGGKMTAIWANNKATQAKKVNSCNGPLSNSPAAPTEKETTTTETTTEQPPRPRQDGNSGAGNDLSRPTIEVRTVEKGGDNVKSMTAADCTRHEDEQQRQDGSASSETDDDDDEEEEEEEDKEKEVQDDSEEEEDEEDEEEEEEEEDKTRGLAESHSVVRINGSASPLPSQTMNNINRKTRTSLKSMIADQHNKAVQKRTAEQPAKAQEGEKKNVLEQLEESSEDSSSADSSSSSADGSSTEDTSSE